MGPGGGAGAASVAAGVDVVGVVDVGVMSSYSVEKNQLIRY